MLSSDEDDMDCTVLAHQPKVAHNVNRPMKKLKMSSSSAPKSSFSETCSEELRRRRDKQIDTDVVLRFRHMEFYAHRNVLEKYSQYCARYFSGPWQQKGRATRSVTVIDISGGCSDENMFNFEKDVIEQTLEYFYGRVPKITLNNLKSFLNFSIFFGSEEMIYPLCTGFIISALSAKTALMFWIICVQYSLDREVSSLCANVASINFDVASQLMPSNYMDPHILNRFINEGLYEGGELGKCYDCITTDSVLEKFIYDQCQENDNSVQKLLETVRARHRFSPTHKLVEVVILEKFDQKFTYIYPKNLDGCKNKCYKFCKPRTQTYLHTKAVGLGKNGDSILLSSDTGLERKLILYDPIQDHTGLVSSITESFAEFFVYSDTGDLYCVAANMDTKNVTTRTPVIYKLHDDGQWQISKQIHITAAPYYNLQDEAQIARMPSDDTRAIHIFQTSPDLLHIACFTVNTITMCVFDMCRDIEVGKSQHAFGHRLANDIVKRDNEFMMKIKFDSNNIQATELRNFQEGQPFRPIDIYSMGMVSGVLRFKLGDHTIIYDTKADTEGVFLWQEHCTPSTSSTLDDYMLLGIGTSRVDAPLSIKDNEVYFVCPDSHCATHHLLAGNVVDRTVKIVRMLPFDYPNGPEPGDISVMMIPREFLKYLEKEDFCSENYDRPSVPLARIQDMRQNKSDVWIAKEWENIKPINFEGEVKQERRDVNPDGKHDLSLYREITKTLTLLN